MSDNIQALIEEQSKAIGAFKNFNIKRMDEMQEQLDRVETILNRPDMGSGRIDGAGYQREVEALGKFALTGRFDSMSTASDPDGGYTTTPTLSRSILEKIRLVSPMRQICRVIPIETGVYEEPREEDESDAEGAGELEARDETDGPSFGLLRIPVKELYAQPAMSQTLLEDSPYNVGAWLEGKLVKKFARAEGAAFVSGATPNRPVGFLEYSQSSDGDSDRAVGTIQTVSSGHATLIKADGLKDLCFTVSAVYRQENAVWLMNSNTGLAISKLKNGNGDYIWSDSLSSGMPNFLLGFPVKFDENMPEIAAGATPVAFGSFENGYTIIDRLQISILRDPFSAKPYVRFYSRRRVGGGVHDSCAIKLLKIEA